MSEAPRRLLEACFRAALARVEGGAVVAAALEGEGDHLRIAGEALPPAAALRVLAVGKAAAPMAAAASRWAGPRLREGLVVTKQGHGAEVAGLRLLEAAHPVPDARSEAAGREALALVRRGHPEEVLLVLLSGGTSALLTCPEEGLDAADLRAATDVLLRAGAPIEALNTVRKHLTAVSAGRLAVASPAQRIHLLALSDVAGDDPALIGSGPCTPDPSTWADARAAVRGLGVEADLPRAVRERLRAGCEGRVLESPKPGASGFERVRSHVLARNGDALEAAAAAARERGVRPVVSSASLRGEARVAGARLAAMALSSSPAEDVCLVAGGETTVTVRGSGRGGRCQELALAAALALEGSDGAALLAAGTDGTDGPTDAAGAFADGGSVARGAHAAADARAALADNDAYAFFAREGGLLRTGPTGTNVMDVVLVWKRGERGYSAP